MKDQQTVELENAIVETILESSARLRRRKNGPSPDLLSSLSKLINSYRKLKYEKRCGQSKDVDPSIAYYESLKSAK